MIVRWNHHYIRFKNIGIFLIFFLIAGKAMNRFLNENWRIVAAELRPALEEAIGNELQGIANKLFDAYPIKNLLPD